MGRLVDGEWVTGWIDTKSTGGKFVRQDSVWRNWVTPDGAPGRVFEVDALADRLRTPAAVSTHGVDVGAAIELARAMGAMPRSLRVIGIEAAGDDHGAPLTPEVTASVDRVARHLAAG